MRETLKLALEVAKIRWDNPSSERSHADKMVIDACEEALAQPEQEMIPLHIEWEPGYPEDVAFGTQRQMDRLKKWLDKYFTLIQAQPEQEPWCMKMNGCKTKCADCPDEPAQPEQEPVAIVIKSGVNRTWMSEALGQLPDGTYSLYTTPPAQREWVGLTDDDLVACSEAQKATVIYFLAKLKKLNT